MEFILNGDKVQYDGDSNLSLLKFLRNIQGITSPKDGCSGEGACGACTVQLDDKAVLSCVTPMKKVEGRSVITTEGIGQRIQEIFAKAFAEEGGIQCGFCTPGIVMSAKVLLEKNLKPSKQEIIQAINKNICRCTGYKKIIDAIIKTAKYLRGDQELLSKQSNGKIGSRYPKYDASQTILGKRPFVCDLKEPNMQFAALKFSDHPRAKILSIDTAEAKQVDGVTAIYTAKDIPGERYTGLIVKDWPLMIAEGEETRYIGDVLASVVATTEEIARQAVEKIKVNYQVLSPVCTVDQAMKVDAPAIHPEGNILSVTRLKRGNAQEELKKSAYVSRGTYYTQRVEHGFLETECCLARPWMFEGEQGIQIFSQGQGAYEDRKSIAKILNIPIERVNVIQVQNGGGFGGKEDLTVQGHVAMCSYLLNVPVKLFLTRQESMSMHPKRHPMRLKYTLGCDQKGKLTALECVIDGDTGAYASVGMKVLERAAGHGAGAYVVNNIDLKATAVYTNNIPCGAMRGFGVNQAAFAMESCIDDLCEQGGFDRWQFRYDNAVRVGQKLCTGQLLRGGVGLRDTLLAIKEKFYQAKYAGIACGIKNTGIGNGVPDTSKAMIHIESTNKIIIYHGWTEMGQGVHTMALQTFCQETEIDPKIVEVRVDTTSETVCGMTTASRGTSLVGNAVIDACKELKEDLKTKSLKELVGNIYRGEWTCDWTSEIGQEKPNVGHETHYSYGYASQLAILDDSGKIEKIYAAHDAGKIMNPNLFEGQIEGAVHMGTGYALTENFPMEDGRPVSLKYAKCGILRAKNTPEVEVIGVEAGDLYGPYGAKGVGEIGLVPTAPALANALYQFDKVRRYSLPFGIKK